jgi:hypothetical protein
MRISYLSLNLCLSLLLNMLSVLFYKSLSGRTEKIEEQELGKMSNHALTDLIVALLHSHRPTPSPPRSSWCLTPLPHRCRPCISTTVAFDRATPSSIRAAPIPFPRPTGEPADGVLRPRCPSKGSSRWVMCRPQLGLSQMDCIGP